MNAACGTRPSVPAVVGMTSPAAVVESSLRKHLSHRRSQGGAERSTDQDGAETMGGRGAAGTEQGLHHSRLGARWETCVLTSVRTCGFCRLNCSRILSPDGICVNSGCTYGITAVNFWKGQLHLQEAVAQRMTASQTVEIDAGTRRSRSQTRSQTRSRSRWLEGVPDLSLEWHTWHGQVHVKRWDNVFLVGSSAVVWTPRKNHSDGGRDQQVLEAAVMPSGDAAANLAHGRREADEGVVDGRGDSSTNPADGNSPPHYPTATGSGVDHHGVVSASKWLHDIQSLVDDDQRCTVHSGAHTFHNPFWQDVGGVSACSSSPAHQAGTYVHFMQCCLHNYGHFLTEGSSSVWWGVVWRGVAWCSVA